MIHELPLLHADSTDFGGRYGLFIPKHLEVILEDVDELVRLQSLLYSICYSIYKFI